MLQTHTHNMQYFCFSTATIFARTPLNVKLYVHCPSCLGTKRIFTRIYNAGECLRKFVTGISTQRPGFDPRTVHVDFMVDNVIWRGFSLSGPPLWSSDQSFWLQIQRSRVRFPALPDFLISSGSGTGSTQPREVN